MEFGVWLAMIGLFLAGGLTPGPAVMLVVSSSLRYGFRPAMLPAIGVSTANLVWISLAAGGAAAIAAQFPAGFLVLKLAGLCFIGWLAIGLIRARPRDLRLSREAMPKRAALFGKGLGLQLANPNALVFFGALLPGYFDASRPLILQVAIAIATITFTEMLGLAFYAAGADRLARSFATPSFAKWFNRGAAALMFSSAAFAVWATSR
ncbi:LysE family translocator [Henriciella mobilis]|uniref:LysE family translocator n=1 Tax=Henriciella mobilis TaxID=2305467 RepID=A0A399RJ34_9PROT|nr:LysE family translocator [Henriciella mobilis]RIJ30563.1 LysE family translocator [Henriciella mobilis]